MVITDYNSLSIIWWSDYIKSGFSNSAVYLHDILILTSILGISAFYHDSAATLLIDGEIVAAAQEERFTRIKHDSSYPKNAIDFVLAFSNLKILEVNKIKVFLKMNFC